MEKEQEKKKSSATDYLANERTFLAWVRTGIGIMAFGFVVVKFSLFVKQISMILNKEHTVEIHHTGYSAIVGIILVGVGVLTILLSYFRYRFTNNELDKGSYTHSSLFITLLTSAIFFISILLVYYLIKTT